MSDKNYVLITTVVPLAPVLLADKAVTDKVTLDKVSPASSGSLGKFRAVGAVADALYQSGRVIPAEVQQAAVRAINGRQLTMFVDHPGKEVEDYQKHVGKLSDVCGHITGIHYDPKSKQTVLDSFEICKTPLGKTAMDLFESGIQLGISQRALGTQEQKTWKDESGEEHQAFVVTALEIYGYDLVHLPDANAGNVTEIQPLRDSVMAALHSTAVDLEALTEDELNKFAPLSDGAVAVHSPEKADIHKTWRMSSTEQNKLPDRAFAWLSEEYLKGSSTDKSKGRKLPHHTKGMETVFSAVRAAMAALHGARGGVDIPEADREGVYKHLAAHYKQFGVEPPPFKGNSKDSASSESISGKEPLPESSSQPAQDSVLSAQESGSTMTATVKTEESKPAATETVVADTATQTTADTTPAKTEEVKAEAKVETPAPVVDDAKAKMAALNKQLVTSMKASLDTFTETAKALITDSLKNRMAGEAAKDALWQKVGTTLKHASTELDCLMTNDSDPTATNSSLMKLSTDMNATMAEIVKGIVEMCKQEEVAEGGAQNDSKGNTSASATELTDKGAEAMPDKPVEVKEVSADAATQKPAYVPPVDEAKVLADKAIAEKEAAEKALAAAQKVMDSMKTSMAGMTQLLEDTKKLADLKNYAKSAIDRQELSEEVRKAVADTVLAGLNSMSTKESIEDSVKNAVSLASHSSNSARVDEQLKALGLASTGEGVTMTTTNLTDKGSALAAPHLKGVQAITDMFYATGSLQSQAKDKYKNMEDVPLKVRDMLQKFDSVFAGQLASETARLQPLIDAAAKLGKSESILDAAAAADFQVPYLISRVILFEVYASDMIQALSDTGTMEGPRDQVPITRWRRDAVGNAATFKPSVAQRSSLRVPELGAIPRGKLVTEFVNIDAVKRSGAATMSDEFMARAKRRPDITGTAMALNNLIDEVRRAIQQDIFWEMIRAGLMNGSSTFSQAVNTDGTHSVYQVTGTGAPLTTLDPAVAVSIVPDDPVHSPLVVRLGTTSGNMSAVPLFGTSLTGGGPGSAYFYTVDYAAASISLVDSSGAASIPASGTANMLVTGRKADGEVRFNLNNDSGEKTEDHMQRLLFAVQNQRARNSSGGISPIGFYDADVVVASVVNSEYMKQASAYAALFNRKGFSADALIKEGNYGITAGLGHWGSKVFSDQFVVIGDSKGVLFKTFEPLSLKGPIAGRDSTGQLNGSQEWYTYQEDSIATPIVEKFCVITLYRK